MNSIEFRTLKDAQDITKIVSIFSHGVKESTLKSPTPIFVVIVGAPGVGKTTQAKKILLEHGHQYENCYNVSLDSLVERVRPYRITTKLLYDEMRKKRLEQLTDEDYAVLNEVYMATIRSKDLMFDSTYTVHRILGKMEGEEKKEKEKPKESKYHTLTELRKKGLEYGIKQGFNIIYDTTFSSTKNVIGTDILPLLEKQTEITYQILVLHVSSTEEQIRKQLKHRHKQMVKEGYIRAIGPKLTKKFIKENQVGMENAERYCTSEYQKEHETTRYTPDKFIFRTILNEPRLIPLSPSRFSNDDQISQEIIRSPRRNASTRKKKDMKRRLTAKS
jgi:signal recognition particle GTPase